MKCEVSVQYAKDDLNQIHFYCIKCGKEMGIDEERDCSALKVKIPIIGEVDSKTEKVRFYSWEDDLFKLSEKHCKHDDKDMNSCLYYIFKPFIQSLLDKQRKEIIENQYDMMMKSLPSDAENLSTLTPDQAFRLMKSFLKKSPWN